MKIKTVLITGSSRGIGAAIAKRLADSETPYRIIINYNSSEDRAREVVEYIRSKGKDAIMIKADVSNYEEVRAMFDEVQRRFKKVDILINNAGIAFNELFQDISLEHWNSVFGVNVNGTFHATKCVIDSMLSNHEGVILNVASMWGLVGCANEVCYAATKAAIISMTKSLAKEVGFSNIRVNAIAPGAIDTEMLDQLDSSVLDAVKDETPRGRLGTPEEVAELCEYLISDRASFITGSVFSMTGGLVI